EVMGYSLEEVHAVLAARDRLDAIREAWRAGGEGPAGQLRLLEEALATLQSSRRRTRVKVERLAGILERLDATIARYEAVAEDLRQSEAGARGEAAGEEPARV
ncbi:MAG: hypothetical protein ACRD0J_16580, partial [Acidimicrobiales bacterium]